MDFEANMRRARHVGRHAAPSRYAVGLEAAVRRKSQWAAFPRVSYNKWRESRVVLFQKRRKHPANYRRANQAKNNYLPFISEMPHASGVMPAVSK